MLGGCTFFFFGLSFWCNDLGHKLGSVVTCRVGSMDPGRGGRSFWGPPLFPTPLSAPGCWAPWFRRFFSPVGIFLAPVVPPPWRGCFLARP